jgi:hypothetical protein
MGWVKGHFRNGKYVHGYYRRKKEKSSPTHPNFAETIKSPEPFKNYSYVQKDANSNNILIGIGIILLSPFLFYVIVSAIKCMIYLVKLILHNLGFLIIVGIIFLSYRLFIRYLDELRISKIKASQREAYKQMVGVNRFTIENSQREKILHQAKNKFVGVSFSEGKIKIKSESLPERCEVCHQKDCFNPVSNFCSRCKDYSK